MQQQIPCTVMRGGTSKGLYFLAGDLPADPVLRDQVLLAAMGSPDERQIDGMGGSNPLTSKVAVIGPPTRPDADIDYLFLQVVVDEPRVDPSQNCGNILAGVGPLVIEKGLVRARSGTTQVRIHMVNTASIAVATVQTPGGVVTYHGDARIDGVPGTAAPVLLDFQDIAGSSCGALLPTGNARDRFEGVDVTCIDNGMPVVILAATDLGKTGYESPAELEADEQLRARVEAIRLAAGRAMNLGDVTAKTVPKMCLVAPPKAGGALCTRSFIPKRVHEAIGVLGAVSVATAAMIEGSVAARIADMPVGSAKQLMVEHPTGFFTVDMDVTRNGAELVVRRAALLRTARKLMSGEVYVPASVADIGASAPQKRVA